MAIQLSEKATQLSNCKL